MSIRRGGRFDRDMAKLMSKCPEDILTWLESEDSDPHRLTRFLYNNRRMHELQKVFSYPMAVAFFMRPMSHLENDVFEAMSRVSALHAMFARCWGQARHKVDTGELNLDCDNKKPKLTQLGSERVWVKTEPLNNPTDLWRLNNESVFAKASVSLTLLGLSYGCVPFSTTTMTAERMVVTSSDGGVPLKTWKGDLVPTVYQSMMALWGMRAYGNVIHLDAHLENFTVMTTDPTDLVWAWSFDTGLESPMSNTRDHIQGFCLPGCTTRVTMIDGGFSSTTDVGRRPHHKFYRKQKTTMGWDELNVSMPVRLLGLEVMNKTRKIENNEWYFVPLLHFDDIPDAVVDIVSFFACMYARGAMRDASLKIIGTLVRLARADPEFTVNTFIEFLIRVNDIIGGLTSVDRDRTPTDYVIPMPEPSEEVDALVQMMTDSVFGDM